MKHSGIRTVSARESACKAALALCNAALLAFALALPALTLALPAGAQVVATPVPKASSTVRSDGVAASALPQEAQTTLALIRKGGPYPYRQDDGIFGNRERLLPSQPRGYYREYTVPTPGARDRGARRIVAGGRPPREFFYTDDHYRTFRRIAEN